MDTYRVLRGLIDGSQPDRVYVIKVYAAANDPRVVADCGAGSSALANANLIASALNASLA